MLTCFSVRVIARGTLYDFLRNRVEAKSQNSLKGHLDAWFAETAKAAWRNSAELKRQYGSASIVSSERVVFNIKGNHYRLVVAIDYNFQIVLIKWLGSHAEYDKIDAKKVEYDKSRYANPSHPD